MFQTANQLTLSVLHMLLWFSSKKVPWYAMVIFQHKLGCMTASCKMFAAKKLSLHTRVLCTRNCSLWPVFSLLCKRLQWTLFLRYYIYVYVCNRVVFPLPQLERKKQVKHLQNHHLNGHYLNWIGVSTIQGLCKGIWPPISMTYGFICFSTSILGSWNFHSSSKTTKNDQP